MSDIVFNVIYLCSFDSRLLLSVYNDQGSFLTVSIFWKTFWASDTFFHKYLSEFTRKIIWACSFVQKKIFNYKFNVFHGYWPSYSFISSWISFNKFSSVAQSCLYLCHPMDCSTPGFSVHHQLPELNQTHIHRISDAIQPFHPLSFPFFSCLQSFPASGSFPMSQLFTWGGQSTGGSALTSVLPKNTQGWSPSEWTGWISFQSKELSRAFSNTTVQKHQFFSAQLSSQSNSHIHTWLLEKP